MLKLDDITYREAGFTLNADFALQSATLTAVLGPSGAGKSTLLNLIAGFAKPESGAVIIGGANVTALPPRARLVSFVFQDNNVFPHLTLWQNVALGIAPNLKLSPSQSSSVSAALARVGLVSLAQKKPGEVSGGERQRVALARMLVREAGVLLLDEPFAALDPALRQDMLALVKELTRERNLVTLLVSHQPLEILPTADAVLFVAQGMAFAPRPSHAFLASRNPEIRAYLGRTNPI